METKKLHGPLMLENSAFFFSFLFRSLVGMVLIDCKGFKSKNKFLVAGLKTIFCRVFLTGPIVTQVSINSELLPCINKFKMK